jgi:hypothetical protein
MNRCPGAKEFLLLKEQATLTKSESEDKNSGVG